MRKSFRPPNPFLDEWLDQRITQARNPAMWATCPIVANRIGAVDAWGTCVRIKYGDRYGVVTAAHVIANARKASQSGGVGFTLNNEGYPMSYGFPTSADGDDDLDAAVWLSDEKMPQPKIAADFLPLELCSPNHIVKRNGYYFFHGYPVSKHPRRKGKDGYWPFNPDTIGLPGIAETDCQALGFDPRKHILLPYLEKGFRNRFGGNLRAPKYDGFSGSGLWTVPREGEQSSLVGILSRKDSSGKFLVFTRIKVHLLMLEKFAAVKPLSG